jgi:hypothetical protein
MAGSLSAGVDELALLKTRVSTSSQTLSWQTSPAAKRSHALNRNSSERKRFWGSNWASLATESAQQSRPWER